MSRNTSKKKDRKEFNEQDTNPIKETFSITVFAAKQWLPPHEYYLHIAKKAIDCGLLSNAEFKMFTDKFLKMKLSPFATCQAFDTIIKKRWEERDTENYFHQNNRLASERNSFFNKLVKKNES